MICQSCGVEAPTQKVFFMQHVGMLIAFRHSRIGGQFCRTCVQQHFRRMTLTTLFLGWWGMISMFATPIVLLNNIFNRLRARGLAPVPPAGQAPRLTGDA